MPTGIRAYAVLDGGNAGKIMTDDPVHPQWGYVWEADDGTLYRGGTQNIEILYSVISVLRQDGIVALGFRESDPFVNLFPPELNTGAACLEFDRPAGSSDLTPYLDGLPVGYEIHRMGRTLLGRCPRCNEKINRYINVSNFLDKGLGICILKGDEIVCEAYADMEVRGYVSLAFSPREPFGGKDWRRSPARI